MFSIRVEKREEARERLKQRWVESYPDHQEKVEKREEARERLKLGYYVRRIPFVMSGKEGRGA